MKKLIFLLTDAKSLLYLKLNALSELDLGSYTPLSKGQLLKWTWSCDRVKSTTSGLKHGSPSWINAHPMFITLVLITTGFHVCIKFKALSSQNVTSTRPTSDIKVLLLAFLSPYPLHPFCWPQWGLLRDKWSSYRWLDRPAKFSVILIRTKSVNFIDLPQVKTEPFDQ